MTGLVALQGIKRSVCKVITSVARGGRVFDNNAAAHKVISSAIVLRSQNGEARGHEKDDRRVLDYCSNQGAEGKWEK